ncbi:MAG: glycosyltransferase family 4 protein [Candidatus Thiodiazotropha sp.]|jgi:glycosyltransferase involved in cell wall biosynthesis
MREESILIMMQYGTNIGYAIAPLETTFYNMASELGFPQNRIHFSYQDMKKGMPDSLPSTFSNVVVFNSRSDKYSKEEIDTISRYISKNNIKYIFGFDLPAKKQFYKPVRAAGVEKIISYYGCTMSSVNSGLKLFLKKLEMKLNIYGPDHYIFESKAMQYTATHGRGVAAKNTSVVPLGVDHNMCSNKIGGGVNIFDEFNIPKNRKVIFYSGHMHKRKGVHVLIDAVSELINNRNREDIHLLLFGNKEGETAWLEDRFKGTKASEFITFGGYRTDLPSIMPQCYLGVIASNGWDSFPRSAIEMQSCGLPLIASNFQGLVETIENEVTGMLFESGSHMDLGDKIEAFINDVSMRNKMSDNARKRVEGGYTLEVQLRGLVGVVRDIVA